MPGSNFGELGIVFQKELKVPAARRTLSPSMHRISCCVPRASQPKTLRRLVACMKRRSQGHRRADGAPLESPAHQKMRVSSPAPGMYMLSVLLTAAHRWTWRTA